ncbi:hypothetical protein Bsp3421_004645 [Burkholderia sp. FERM BP-3421]|uniref:hypothetical protein n=1 Tax=Burkholderia sp. FERM BP-3421 TaxID=1494466 RepID=UPI00236046FA|nr:hypothetical protein [Burkholderia sp. FERM BP-3421]WDD94517.1 hypothetical protein Bsp3421_004645 [Burkholderia sp. FERM BP-3421]
MLKSTLPRLLDFSLFRGAMIGLSRRNLAKYLLQKCQHLNEIRHAVRIACIHLSISGSFRPSSGQEQHCHERIFYHLISSRISQIIILNIVMNRIFYQTGYGIQVLSPR